LVLSNRRREDFFAILDRRPRPDDHSCARNEGLLTHHGWAAHWFPCARRRRLTRRGARAVARHGGGPAGDAGVQAQPAQGAGACHAVASNLVPISPRVCRAKPSTRLLAARLDLACDRGSAPTHNPRNTPTVASSVAPYPVPRTAALPAVHHLSPSLATAPRHFGGGNLEFTSSSHRPPTSVAPAYHFCSRYPHRHPLVLGALHDTARQCTGAHQPASDANQPPPDPFPPFLVPNKRSWRRIARRSSSASVPSAR
jgi:hypothetical protein